MSLAAGELRHQLRIEELVQAEDPNYGGPAGPATWKEVTVIWARRRNMVRATAEAVASGTTVAPLQVTWDVRPRPLDPANRLVGVGGDHDGVIYDIANVAISNDNSEMAVVCTSGASNG
ncbi:MAG: head-tail adaptor protein [Sphingobium limneticum]